MTNVVLVLKDSKGNIGIVKPLTDKDIIKIADAITDVGQVVDPATHMPIEATKTSAGVVQLATATDIENGTAGKVVDAQELNNFAQTLPSVNGITDVSSGDNSNQIVVSKFGGSKTLTIDNVEHAGNADEATHATQADTATSANSVAWNNVSGKPSSYTPSSHTHDDRYYTESEIDTKLSGKSDTSHNHNSTYLGITAKAESAKSADSVSWGNVSDKPTKVSQFTNDSNYLTGITKAMVTTALGYTPPTSDTNTHYTTTLYAGAKDAKSNAATTNGNTYIKLYDDSTVRSQLNIKGSGATSVTTDANGAITISSTDNNTTYSFSNKAATLAWNTAVTVATVGGVDITVKLPANPNTNTWNALKGSTTSAAGTAGYAPAPAAGAANRYLRCDGTWQVPPDHTYTVNNATLTIQKNGTNVATFTSNASSNVTANISVPTKVSQLTNDVGFITSTASSLEMYEATPYIDFHAMKSTNDHTSRIIDQGNTNAGRLRILARYDSISYQVEMYKNFFEPVNDNEICLGNSVNRWRNIFGATGSISTSDQRAKNSIENIDDSLLDAWSNVQPKQYKFNDATKEKGDSARYHTGYLAQDIQKACEDSKISIDRYGLFCHDSWEEQDEVVENIESEVDGIKTTEKRIVQQKREKGDMYALRYEEALVVECAYLRRENSRMKEKLVSLEERLEKLEKAEK